MGTQSADSLELTCQPPVTYRQHPETEVICTTLASTRYRRRHLILVWRGYNFAEAVPQAIPQPQNDPFLSYSRLDWHLIPPLMVGPCGHLVPALLLSYTGHDDLEQQLAGYGRLEHPFSRVTPQQDRRIDSLVACLLSLHNSRLHISYHPVRSRYETRYLAIWSYNLLQPMKSRM